MAKNKEKFFTLEKLAEYNQKVLFPASEERLFTEKEFRDFRENDFYNFKSEGFSRQDKMFKKLDILLNS